MAEKHQLEIGRFGAVSAMSATKSDEHPAYQTWDSCDLYDRAREMAIEGCAFMTKTELITALRKI